MNALLRSFFKLFQGLHDARTHGAQLLCANLTPDQLWQLKERKYFEVTGGTSGTCYRIYDSFAINVDQLDENKKVVRKWCFTPEGSLVRGDVLLAQKLALELFEDEALSIANGYPPQR